MKVILNADVASLGEEGEVRTVAPGYARNYLLPKGLVLEYNERNLAKIEARRAEIDSRRALKRQEASSLKQRLEAEPVLVSMTAGANGKLFGSVTAATIVEQLAARGIEVERKRVDVPDTSLKAVGNYKVRVRLYGDEEATVLVQVTASNASEVAREQRAQRTEAPAEAAPAPEDESTDEQGGASSDVDDDSSDGDDSEYLDPEMIAMQQAAEEDAAAADDE